MSFSQFGSRRRARTADPVINSHLLYRLSYPGLELRRRILRRLADAVKAGFCFFYNALFLLVSFQKFGNFVQRAAEIVFVLQEDDTEVVGRVPVEGAAVDEEDLFAA